MFIYEHTLFASPFLGERHDDTVVDNNGDHNGGDKEDSERAGRDLEGPDGAFHGGSLFDGESDHLSVSGPEQNGGRPYRKQPYHHLHFLHFRHRAKLPWIPSRHIPVHLKVSLFHYRCLVQEPTRPKINIYSFPYTTKEFEFFVINFVATILNF